MTSYKQPWVRISLALIAAPFLAGCAPESETKIVRVAYASGPSELLHFAAQRFEDLVEEKSNGKLEVRLYPSGQLGNEREIVEGLKLKTVDVVITGCALVGWYAPEYGAIEAPFIWRDYDHIERVWAGAIGEQLKERMGSTAGIDMRALWYRGPRYLTTTSKPIHSPEDLAGLKLRVPELEVYMKSWLAFGANATPLPFSDMFMALRLGVVEGQENPLATIYGNNLHEVQKYIMETKHLVGFYIVSTGPYFEGRFSPEERRCILESLEKATDWHNDELNRKEGEYRNLLIEAGAEFVEVDRESFQRVAEKKIPQLFEKKWKKDLYRQIINSP